MSSAVGLKTSYAPLSHYNDFYSGGKVQVSSDGQYLFCTDVAKVKVFNIQTGCVDFSVEEEDDSNAVKSAVDPGAKEDDFRITCFVVSPDDQYLITTNNKMQLLRQWDWKKMKLVRTWRTQSNFPVTCLAFDCSSTLLAAGTSDSTVRVFDIEKQYCTNHFRGHKGVVNLVKFHPDTSNCRLFTASEDCVIRLWDLQTHNCLIELLGHYSIVTSLQFQNEGAVMYSSSRDNTVFVWDTSTFTKKVISVFEPIESVVLLPKKEMDLPVNINSNDNHFVTAGAQGILKVWNAEKSACVFEIKDDDRVTADSDQNLSEGNEHGFVFADYIKKLDVVLVVTHSNNIILYNRNNFFFFKQFAGRNDEIYCIKFFGADDSHIAVATNSSAIKVFEVNTWSCQILTGHTGLVMSLDTCEIDGTVYLVSGGKDNTVRLWTMDSDHKCFECRAIGLGHNLAVSAVVLLKCTAPFAVSAANDLSLKLWKFSMGEDGKGKLRVKQTVGQAHSKDVNDITVSPKDRFLATASQDKTAKLWDVSTLSLITVFNHSRGVQCVKFSPTENILGTSSADRTIRLWELKNFKCIKTFEGHENAVLSFNFLSRGLQLISGDADGLMKLWLVRTSECTKTFDEHQGKLWALEVNKKEDRILTGGADSRMVLWKDRTEEEREEKRIKDQESIQNEQQLANLLKDKKYNKALLLAIRLERPSNALNILKEIWKMPTREEYMMSTFRPMRPDQIQTVLEFVSVWNSNSKHSHVAQAVLATIFKMYGPDKLLDFPEIRKLVENLIPYTDRHYSRLKLLEQKSEFVDYSCLLLRTLEPMDTE